MPTMSGSFSGSARVQSSVSLPDRPGHELSLAEISGTQKCSDEKWNNAAINYWGFMDLAGDSGTQRGYFVNNHGEAGRDWGMFEGKVAVNGTQVTVEGTWQFTGGSGKFSGLTGKGTFKTVMSSPTEVQATWQGAYDLAIAKAQAG